MTRSSWIRMAIAVSALVLIATVTSVQAGTVIRIAHESSVEHNIHKSLLFFAKVAAEKTKGDVEARVFPSGQLGDERAILEGVKIGTIDAGSAGGLYTTIDPRFALLNLPFLFRDYDHVHKVLDGPIGADLKDRAWKNGIKIMCIFDSGFRQFTNNKRPITKPEDFKGLKMRTPPIPEIVDTMGAFGASVVTIPYGEVYTALRAGVADGEENSLTNITEMKFYEVQKYISVGNYMYNGDMFIMSPKLWNSFSPQTQKALEEATTETLAYQRKLIREEEQGASAIIKKAGGEINTVNQALFIPLVDGVYQKNEKAVPKSLIEEIRKIK
jgi:TRAP-type transport system periplasmic protein